MRAHGLTDRPSAWVPRPGSQPQVDPHRWRGRPQPSRRSPSRSGAPPSTTRRSRPTTAEFLRNRATRIRQGVKSTVEAICDIGVQLCGAKQMLGHGQFVQWVESECGFSLRSAQNYMRASEFAADKYATVALLPPADGVPPCPPRTPHRKSSLRSSRARRTASVSRTPRSSRCCARRRNGHGLRAGKPKTRDAAPAAAWGGVIRAWRRTQCNRQSQCTNPPEQVRSQRRRSPSGNAGEHSYP